MSSVYVNMYKLCFYLSNFHELIKMSTFKEIAFIKTFNAHKKHIRNTHSYRLILSVIIYY